ncbi:Uncharacterised protein [uncultured archaeon]|nr:Uncharacterised protein [uncultured archaeon]
MIDESNIIERYLPRVVIGVALLGIPAGIASRYYLPMGNIPIKKENKSLTEKVSPNYISKIKN